MAAVRLTDEGVALRLPSLMAYAAAAARLIDGHAVHAVHAVRVVRLAVLHVGRNWRRDVTLHSRQHTQKIDLRPTGLGYRCAISRLPQHCLLHMSSDNAILAGNVKSSGFT